MGLCGGLKGKGCGRFCFQIAFWCCSSLDPVGWVDTFSHIFSRQSRRSFFHTIHTELVVMQSALNNIPRSMSKMKIASFVLRCPVFQLQPINSYLARKGFFTSKWCKGGHICIEMALPFLTELIGVFFNSGYEDVAMSWERILTCGGRGETLCSIKEIHWDHGKWIQGWLRLSD